jgi:hypothetical protein
MLKIFVPTYLYKKLKKNSNHHKKNTNFVGNLNRKQNMLNQQRYFEIFLQAISKNIEGELRPSIVECEKYFASIKEDALSPKKFFLAVDVKKFSFVFQHNLEIFLPVKGNIEMMDYIGLIHPEYVQEFSDWASCVYAFAEKTDLKLTPLSQCYKIMLPMRTLEGYYWVLQEGYPLQLDSTGRMASHINEYTIIAPFEAFSSSKHLLGSLWINNFENKVWTQELHKLFFTREPFVLSKTEKEILEFVKNNFDKEFSELAEAGLIKSLATFNTHTKNIIKKAKKAFPNQFAANERTTIKAVILYLRQLEIALDKHTEKDIIYKML